MADTAAASPHGFRVLYCQNCGNSVRVPIHCSSRSCVPCLFSRSLRVQSRISWILSFNDIIPGYSWKHLTLTVRNMRDLSKGIDLLISSFRRLRQHRWWKSRVLGGCYVLEVVRHENLWHPHLHIIVYSKYLPWESVLGHWNVASTTGRHIYIRRIWHGTGIAHYIAKYVAKPFMVSPEFQSELDNATRHRRLFAAFGNLAAIIHSHRFPSHVVPCKRCGALAWIPDVLIEIYHRRARAP
jgi:Plasmid rolling circle replication initiator protein and truncated derivatives